MPLIPARPSAPELLAPPLLSVAVRIMVVRVMAVRVMASVIMAIAVMASGSFPSSADAAGDPQVDDPRLILRLRPAGESGLAPVETRLAAALADLAPVWRPAYPAGRAGASGAGARARGAQAANARATLDRTRVLLFPRAAERDAAIGRLRRHPEVVYVEAVRRLELVVGPDSPAGVPPLPPAPGDAPAVIPGDALYGDQYPLALIGMPAAWELNTATPGVRVAVIDTGIELEHPDLVPNLLVNQAEALGLTGEDDDGNGYVDDIHGWDFMAEAPTPNDGHGHGTHVAGLIGAVSDGVYGTVGVTWDVRLIPVKMFTDRAVGTNLSGAQGIVYAVDRGADVINMSWGTPSYSRAIREAIDYAAASGVVLVASAGNDAASVLEVYPAAIDAVITVGATTALDRLASFSNRGPRLDLVAPGVNVLSTWRGRHLRISGTSQAAPHVAGVAAHLLHLHPEFGPAEVRAALLMTARDLGRDGWEPTFGAGRLEAAAAMAVEQPPVALIRAPRTLDSFAQGAIEIRADLTGREVAGRLELGAGTDPRLWEPLWTGGSGTGLELARIESAELTEGDYTLRLGATTAAGERVENRVLIRIDRSAPHLLSVESVQLLAAGRLRQLVRLQAGERVRLRAYLRAVGDPGPFDEVIVDDLEARHTIDFTARWPGPHEFSFELEDQVGLVTRVPEAGPLLVREVLAPIDIPADLMEEVARLPGFELGVVADLDGDGLPELLGELRESLAGSGPMQILSLDGSLAAWRQRYAGLRGLPLDARDLDGNGTIEVLLADSLGSAGPDGSTRFDVYTGFLVGEPTRLASWEDGDRRFGGGFADTDDDRLGEVLYAESHGAELRLLEYRGGVFVPVTLEFSSPTPRTAGFAIDDFDGDGLTEIALGTLSGSVRVLEYAHAGADRLVEVFRQPIRGGLSNAVVATQVHDADGDGRPEFAIASVGVITDSDQRPSVVLFEADGDNSYTESAWFEVRDKNYPFDNALVSGDLSGDGRPELLVAMAGDVYRLDAAGDDRYVPTWHVSRAGGGGLFSTDLDRDGQREVLVVERTAAGPVTIIYQQRLQEVPIVLRWEVRGGLDGVEISWQVPAMGERVEDLAIYRVRRSEPPPDLESDLSERRIYRQEGDLTETGYFLDPVLLDPPADYYVAYTIRGDSSRRRFLSSGREPLPAPPMFRLGRVYPSPFLTSTAVDVTLTSTIGVKLRVYNVSGRLVRDWPEAELPAGHHAIEWDGRDRNLRPVPAGVYFLQVSTPIGEDCRKVVCLR